MQAMEKAKASGGGGGGDGDGGGGGGGVIKGRKYYMGWGEVQRRLEDCLMMATGWLNKREGRLKVWGVPRGGMCVLGSVPLPEGYERVWRVESADIILDDICDSGRTRDLVLRRGTGAVFTSLVT